MAKYQNVSSLKVESTKYLPSDFILEVKNVKNKDDVFDFVSKLEVFFNEADEDQVKLTLTNKESGRVFYDHILWDLLTSDMFNVALQKVMRFDEKETSELKNKLAIEKRRLVENNASKEEFDKYNEERRCKFSELDDKLRTSNLEEKQLIKLMLQASFFSLTYDEKHLTEVNLQYVAKQMLLIIGNIEKWQNYEFHDTKILTTLNEILFDIRYKYNKKFINEIIGRFDSKNLFGKLSQARDFAGVSLVLLHRQRRLNHEFKKVIVNFRKKKKGASIYNSACRLLKILNSSEANINEYLRDYKEKGGKNHLDNFVLFATKKSDTNSLFVIKEMLASFDKANNGDEACELLTSQAKSLKDNISNYFHENFLAFSDSKQEDNDWSNKIFIVTIRALSVFESIQKSSNSNWKRSVFLHEMSIWFKDVNEILNLHNLADDWSKVRKYLAQEGIETEWKSSFYTSTEQVFINDEVEKKVSKEIIKIITKPMLAMMNTNGGTIVVGAVENPEKISRDDVKRNLLTRDGYTFFDLNYEFAKKQKDLDQVKRDLQDIIHVKTGLSAEKFNSLWSIEMYEVKEHFRVCNIAVIKVRKSPEFIYEEEKIEGKLLMTLTRRADGRNVNVNLKEYLKRNND